MDIWPANALDDLVFDRMLIFLGDRIFRDLQHVLHMRRDCSGEPSEPWVLSR
jgi:hypothetical protein